MAISKKTKEALYSTLRTVIENDPSNHSLKRQIGDIIMYEASSQEDRRKVLSLIGRKATEKKKFRSWVPGQRSNTSLSDKTDAVNPEQLAEQAKKGMFTELSKMTDEQLESHFKDAKTLKKFIKDNGGKVHARATMEIAITRLKELLAEKLETES